MKKFDGIIYIEKYKLLYEKLSEFSQWKYVFK